MQVMSTSIKSHAYEDTVLGQYPPQKDNNY